ncbi:MAG: ABC transporter permease, partial [Chloroflexi bacterium]|nr:ABC transporter permease [Chloroflexota bacterium]
MTTNTITLNPKPERGWSSGLGNLFRREAYTWLRTRYGLIQLALWIIIIDGLMAIIISTAGEDLEAGQTIVAASIEPFIGIISLFTSIGIAVVAMGAIVGEKRSGTAAWILSAPVTRSSFLLSKLLVVGVGGIVTMILIPGVVVFL